MSRKENKKETKFRNWLKNTVGEEPVILNKALTDKSVTQLNRYLQNKGYFNNEVDDSLHTRRKKATVHYFINAKQLYSIRRFSFTISDPDLVKPIKICSKKSLVLQGNQYDADVLTSDRDELADHMRILGYYKFNKEYISFKVDSTVGQHKVDIKLVINDPLVKSKSPAGKDTLVTGKHELYYINNIYINTSYSSKEPIWDIADTIVQGEYHFLNYSMMRYKPEVILDNIFIEGSDLYNEERVAYTHKRLSGLKSFKFINITFKETNPIDGENMLDCYIDMTPSYTQSVTLETQGTNRSGDLGISGNISFKNQNTFKGAEELEINLRGGMEVQQIQNTSSESASGNTGIENQLNVSIPFNTLEAGADISLYLPKFLMPFKFLKLPAFYDPKTNIKLSYDYQQRPDYSRNVATMSYGYTWRAKKYYSHSLYPVDINIVKISLDSAFEQTLLNTGNNFLINSYSDHMIVASRYRFTFSNQLSNKFRNFTYFSTGIEGAGNALRLFNNLIGSSKGSDGSYRFFSTEDTVLSEKDPNTGIQYAQYLKLDADWRYYSIINRRSKMVYRLYGGIGIPFTNLSVLPFEKSFFAGGANGIRAWQARTLGPGGLSDTALYKIDQIGDIRLEGNLEYRFNLTKMMKAALFADAGNIWLLYIDEISRPGGEFDTKRFWREIAVGAGFGLRFDFTFFILRLDIGFPVKDPSVQQGERWVLQSKDNYNALKLASEQRKLANLLDEKQEIIDNIEQNVTSSNPSDQATKDSYFEYAKMLANKQMEVISQEQYIGTSEYRYHLKPVLNIGIGYPF